MYYKIIGVWFKWYYYSFTLIVEHFTRKPHSNTGNKRTIVVIPKLQYTNSQIHGFHTNNSLYLILVEIGDEVGAHIINTLPIFFLTVLVHPSCLQTPKIFIHASQSAQHTEGSEMGNCQAIDNASLVIQQPCGKVDKAYWPVPASYVMKSNPGYHVALLLTTTLYPPSSTTTASDTGPLRVTRIKLLRPTDTLLLGHTYRLVSSQGTVFYGVTFRGEQFFFFFFFVRSC